ncbi:MAG: N-acyl-L-amino acid amidohydrolase [Bacteroidota bacterium]|jgi:amidohydrolase|nr:N-acyl-L-amino acid amidohydrolase [Bacteroidota bacterium]
MENLISEIKQLSASYLPEIISIRRHLHENPEISFEEYKTSDFIAARLREYDIPFKQGVVKTGIVALIEGKKPSRKVIALRADMDALPITETNSCEYISRNVGLMHACGHDAHCASLLGAAKILNELKGKFEGTVKLIFQPGEEKLPGGASLMIKEGVLENPAPQTIFGQHVFPSMETGKVGFRPGMYMASTDELYMTVKGKGGHAAMVNDYVNPLLIASAILTELDGVFMKGTQKAPTVLAFGKITGNGATNVIPDEVKIEGTFRTMNEEWRAEAHSKMKKIAAEIAVAMGGSCELKVEHGYPFLVNHEQTTNTAKDAAVKYLGAENVEELPMRMTAEDFAFFSQKVPACFYRLGTANKAKGITSGVHTSTFDIDEKSLEIGAGLLAWITINELNR